MTDDAILKLARERYTECLDRQQDIRDKALKDIRFARLGEQWDDEDQRLRGDRPKLVDNKINVFNNYVVNDIKQSRSKPKARPADEEADVKVADVITSMMDHIFAMGGRAALHAGIENMVSCSMGFFRLVTEYVGKSFKQKIVIKRIANPFRVVMPFHECEEENLSDAEYAFIITKMKRDDFEKKYPNIDVASWDTTIAGMTNWLDNDEVVVAEYYYVEDVDEVVQEGEGEDFRSRVYTNRKVKWCKLCAEKILDRTGWLGKYIPIIALMGPEVDVDGEKHYLSLTRYARDPQKFMNYAKSCVAETLGLAPKSPFMAAEGQVQGYESMWKQANEVPYSTLVYKPQTVGGQLLPPPQRIASVSIPTGLENAARTAGEDMKETIGIWSANLGAPGNEKSGVAINARTRQGSMANYHFYDNTNKALEYLGWQLVDLIPKVYDQAQAIRILGDNRKEEIVQINAPFEKDGKNLLYDVTTGEYDIVMDTSPSFASRRAEIEENIGQLMQRIPPQMAAAIVDIYVRNMDFPNSLEAADRLKKLVPPEVLQEEGETPPPQVLMQQMQQMQMQAKEYEKVIEKMMAEIEEKDRDREQKTDLAILDSETKIQLQQMKSQNDLLVAKMASLEKAIAASQPQHNPADELKKPQETAKE